MKTVKTLISALALCAASAAPGAAVQQFAPVPHEAMVALKETRGKPISSGAGAVFANGRYIAPPYTVSRIGTALFVNNVQVTEELIPWRHFRRAAGMAADDSAAPKSKSAKPAPPRRPPPASRDALDSLVDELEKNESAGAAAHAPPGRAAASIDDFFAKPKPAAQPQAAPTRPRAKSFAHNETTKRYLELINKRRQELDMMLRRGEFIFYGARYYPVKGLRPEFARLLAVLPECLRDTSDPESLQRALRSRGVQYLGMEVCEDLCASKFIYPQLQARREDIRKEREMEEFRRRTPGTPGSDW